MLELPIIAIFIFGVLFIATMLFIAIRYPHPSNFQYIVFRAVLAIALAGVAAVIPGLLEVRFAPAISAGGAIGVFVITYLFSPAKLVVKK